MDRQIELRGGRQNNLKNLDLDLPLGKIIGVCGISGSGKTSLAFDTLFAEGQRRFLTSFSPHTRLYLDQIEKPSVEQLVNLPPAAAIKSGVGKPGRQSTVASGSEILDYARLLYAQCAVPICCGQQVAAFSVDDIAELLLACSSNARLQIGFQAPQWTGTNAAGYAEELIAEGFSRVIVGGQLADLSEFAGQSTGLPGGCRVIVDRLVLGQLEQHRLCDSLEIAMDFGDGQCSVMIEGDELPGFAENAGGRQRGCWPAADRIELNQRGAASSWQVVEFSRLLKCGSCGQEIPEPQPGLFSFSSPLGACAECEGLGETSFYDIEKIVPDGQLTLRGGAIAPWQTPAYRHEQAELEAVADDFGIDLDTPFSELSQETVALIWQGVPQRKFGGLDGFFKWFERRKYKMHLRAFVSRWRSYQTCGACSGARINQSARKFQWSGLSLDQYCGLTTGAALELTQAELANLDEDERSQAVGPLLNQVVNRLQFLVDVGLGYLKLDRALVSLSRGELQRVRLTTALGSELVNTMYVLDEPSRGLHSAEIGGVARSLRSLQQRGNTVVVVDHSREILQACDQLVELGPGAGTDGGQLVFQGTTGALARRATPTGKLLRGPIEPQRSRRRPVGLIRLAGVSLNNLDDVDVDFPLGVMAAITGVSGAGKSSLVTGALVPAVQLAHEDGDSSSRSGLRTWRNILGAELIDEVVLIDQASGGKSARSNPVTYVKAFDEIRNLLAESPQARQLGLAAGAFSFNVDGGRCSHCKGEGQVEIDMHFLPNIQARCQDCGGTRYRPETLEVTYRSKNVSEILAMQISEAVSFFRGQPKIQSRLSPLVSVGIGYLKLGQPANTLSAGEWQRLRLAKFLGGRPQTSTSRLFVLDEPSAGLHASDIQKLIESLDALLNVGHSVLLVEHNLDWLRQCDWLIDLGPGPGPGGGRLVVEGPPEKIMACENSLTGACLRRAAGL